MFRRVLCDVDDCLIGSKDAVFKAFNDAWMSVLDKELKAEDFDYHFWGHNLKEIQGWYRGISEDEWTRILGVKDEVMPIYLEEAPVSEVLTKLLDSMGPNRVRIVTGGRKEGTLLKMGYIQAATGISLHDYPMSCGCACLHQASWVGLCSNGQKGGDPKYGEVLAINDLRQPLRVASRLGIGTMLWTEFQ